MDALKTEVRVRLESKEFACDGVQILELRGREAISEPFWFDIDLVVHDGVPFDVRQALGHAASLVFSSEKEEVRTVHGIVADTVDRLDRDLGYTRYRLRLVPRVHRLSLTSTTEVFLKVGLLDILRTKLERADLGASDLAPRLSALPAARDFWLQYSETDLALVSRHMERWGIFYFFEHETGRDVLVLGDGNEAFRPGDASGPLLFLRRPDEPCITAIEDRASVMAGHFIVDDYDDQRPRLSLRAEAVVPEATGARVVEFIAAQGTQQEGARLARMRADAAQAQAQHFIGQSVLPQIEPGRTFAIENHPRFEGERLLAVSIDHHVVQSVLTHGSASVKPYTNRFVATLASRAYRPPRRTPWPRIAGFVHAITDAAPPGNPGRIAQIDEEGRYTVRFFFDTAEGKRASSSARVRMMQPHAGPGYGMHFPLKPGVEVLVAFVEGDPDRPVIAGAVPNPLTASPVTRANAQMNRIETESGIYITMKDA
jgi:type VI secretion system secreted protein VgrG